MASSNFHPYISVKPFKMASMIFFPPSILGLGILRDRNTMELILFVRQIINIYRQEKAEEIIHLQS